MLGKQINIIALLVQDNVEIANWNTEKNENSKSAGELWQDAKQNVMLS